MKLIIILVLIIGVFQYHSDAAVPIVKLNDGHSIPIIGLGTFLSTGNKVHDAVKDAIEAGYRHIDTAYIYNNEKEIGSALKEVFADGKVKRDDLYIVSKVHNSFHTRSRVKECIKKSLNDLGLEYLDLVLIHWPFGYAETSDNPKDINGNLILSDVDYLETWQGMEDAHSEGLAKSIGVSNFNSEQLERVIKNSKIKPALNQVECHPYLTQKPLIEFCHNRSVAVTAYSPLGAGHLIEEPTLKQIGSKYNKTAAEIMIRYQIERDVIVIPKSTTKSRIIENFNVFDFKLSADDMKHIEALNQNKRFIVPTDAIHAKYYPFNAPF